MMTERKIYIAEMAFLLDRRENTVRGWCRRINDRPPRLPRHLRPKRSKTSAGGAGWRYWTEEQVDGIRAWMVEHRMAPGSGLMNFEPTPEQTDELLTKLRSRQVA